MEKKKIYFPESFPITFLSPCLLIVQILFGLPNLIMADFSSIISTFPQYQD
jgi:hypothetical protein